MNGSSNLIVILFRSEVRRDDMTFYFSRVWNVKVLMTDEDECDSLCIICLACTYSYVCSGTCQVLLCFFVCVQSTMLQCCERRYATIQSIRILHSAFKIWKEGTYPCMMFLGENISVYQYVFTDKMLVKPWTERVWDRIPKQTSVSIYLNSNACTTLVGVSLLNEISIILRPLVISQKRKFGSLSSWYMALRDSHFPEIFQKRSFKDVLVSIYMKQTMDRGKNFTK